VIVVDHIIPQATRQVCNKVGRSVEVVSKFKFKRGRKILSKFKNSKNPKIRIKI